MSEQGQRSKDLARAALLRERIVGALKAAAAPMTTADLCGMSGIVELYHQRMLPEKVDTQVRQLVRAGVALKAGHVSGRGNAALWELNRKRQEEAPQRAGEDALRELRLEVRKQDKSVTFVFEGLRITIQVLP